jgi:hypothetical protein
MLLAFSHVLTALLSRSSPVKNCQIYITVVSLVWHAALSAVESSDESSDFELEFEVFSSNKRKDLTKNYREYI